MSCETDKAIKRFKLARQQNVLISQGGCNADKDSVLDRIHRTLPGLAWLQIEQG